MKKIVSILTITAIIVMALFTLAACNKDETGHKHSLQKIERVEPTCTLAGIKEYYYCECGLKFADAEGTQEITSPEIIQPLGHSYGSEWVVDENGHWHACACESKADEGAHVDAETNKDHKCDTCGYEKSKCHDGDDADHKCDWCGKDGVTECVLGDAWVNDATNHWHACSCGLKADEAAHVDAEPNKDHKCDVCGYEMSKCTDGDDADHRCDWCGKDGITECVFGDAWVTSEAKHWHECACGAKNAEADHIDAEPNKDHKCDTCGYEISKCADGDDADHKCDYCDKDGITNCVFGDEWVTSETKHWHECACGAKSGEASHKDAEPNKDHKCDTCGYVISECADDDDADHKCDYCGKDGITECIFGDEWVTNETKHWHVCACGAKSGEADHIPDRDAATEEDPILCTECGYTLAAALAHTHKFTVVVYDENNHFMKCSGCEEIDPESVTAHVFSESTTASSCTVQGKKTYSCDCGFVKTEKLPLAEHTAADPVTENVVEASCKVEGSYDEVVYCSVCNEELSRTPKIIAIAPHTEQTIPGKAATCKETGLTDGVKCSVCDLVLDEQEVIALAEHTPADAVTENVVPATCLATGSYDTVVYCSVCNVELSRAAGVSEITDHAYGAAIEDADGFHKVCQTPGCGHTIVVSAPIVDSYKASLDNSFVSNKENSHVFVYSNLGAYGIKTNGQHWVETAEGSPESGAIGGIDKQGRYVEYTFTLDKPGTVDLIWSVAGNRYKLENGVAINAGIPNLGGIGVATIDGVAVDLQGIALPAGSGTAMGTSVWWNLQQVVIPGVALDAGVHTFRFEITYIEYYGINIASMTVKSDKEVGVQSASVKSVTIEQENGQIYYTMTMTLGKFVEQADVKFWNEIKGNLIYFDFESFVTDENGLTTARINMTNQATAHDPISPHMSICGQNYINGDNKNGDVLSKNNNKIAFEKTLIQANGKSFLLHNYWNMPALLVVSQNYIRLDSADLYKDTSANKVYYTLKYRVIGYDPGNIQFFDGTTTYATTYTVDEQYFVTYKIDATNLAAIWPHLKVNGTNWDGMNNVKSDNGDVKLKVSEKSVTHNGKTYTLGTEWDMPRMIVS